MNENKIVKVAGEIRSMAVTQKQMAQALGLSGTRINELCDEKVIVRDEFARNGQVLLFESLRNYFLSKKATDDGVNYWLEKARHEKAKRELAELKLDKERGKAYDAAEYEATLLEALSDFKTTLTGLGHKLARQLEGKPSEEICTIIDGEIDQALKELSGNA